MIMVTLWYFVMEDGKSQKGAMVVARGKKTGTLYVNSSCKSTIAVVDNMVSLDLWHHRLSHISKKRDEDASFRWEATWVEGGGS